MSLISDKAIKRLDNSWHGVFRNVILELLPIDILEGNFNPDNGRPTKELYSMCGLILIMQFFGWTIPETSLKYMTDISLQYALNIESDFPELSERTLQRYLGLARNDDVASNAMLKITSTLAKELNLDITKQRLDSTHVFSNMAQWSRKKLYFNIIQRFLKQVKRHALEDYEQLDEDLRKRYVGNQSWIFDEKSPTKMKCRGEEFSCEEHLGYEMKKLIEKFKDNATCTNMSTYKDMLRVFSEQFINDDGLPKLNAHPGGQILLNPSDKEAEVGHKGMGYQVQISETCSENNDVQLATLAMVQGASSSDMNSFIEVVNNLSAEELLPEKLLADGGYGSDSNYTYAKENNVNLIAPAPPKIKNKVGLDECEFDENNVMIKCPSGIKPMHRRFNDGIGRAVYHITTCDKCPLKDKCRSTKYGKQNREFKYTLADLRNVRRRKEEETEEFKIEYSKRSGIEGLNGRLKQYTPLRRLKVRGKSAVKNSIISILAMHNIMQFVRHGKIQAQKARKATILMFWTFKKVFLFSKSIVAAS